MSQKWNVAQKMKSEMTSKMKWRMTWTRGGMRITEGHCAGFGRLEVQVLGSGCSVQSFCRTEELCTGELVGRVCRVCVRFSVARLVTYVGVRVWSA